MYAIVKKAFIFAKPSASKLPANVPGHVRHERINPSVNPVELPQWITETELFKLALAEGSIIEVKGEARKSKVAEAVAPEVESDLGLNEQSETSEESDPAAEKQGKAKNGGKKK